MSSPSRWLCSRHVECLSEPCHTLWGLQTAISFSLLWPFEPHFPKSRSDQSCTRGKAGCSQPRRAFGSKSEGVKRTRCRGPWGSGSCPSCEWEDVGWVSFSNKYSAFHIPLQPPHKRAIYNFLKSFLWSILLQKCKGEARKGSKEGCIGPSGLWVPDARNLTFQATSGPTFDFPMTTAGRAVFQQRDSEGWVWLAVTPLGK